MRRKKTTLLLLTSFVLLMAGCGAGSDAIFAGEPASSLQNLEAGDFDEEFVTNASEPSPDRGAVFDSAGSVTEPTNASAQQRLIIRVGDLNLVVEDTESALTRISKLAEDGGGWVVSSGAYQYSGDAKTGEITIRIPAVGFSSSMAAIKDMALEVTSESTSGQDVTDDFVDLSSRLNNLEATAARVRNFLDSAKDVDDALAVNIELSRLEGDIELIKGRMQFLEQSASFSTITVRLTPDVLSQPIEVGGWRPEGVARNAVEALAEMLELLGSFVIWLAIFLVPLALIILLPLWLAARYLVRRRRRRREATVTDE